MKLSEIPVPQVYKEESDDFRFFLKWFENCLSKVHYDTENTPDLYDPLRCPEWLIWMLADTMGFKYDDRLPMAFNRLVLIYFMSMIRNKGSKDGVTLAAEVNLAQFNILNYGKEKDILNNRLEDTSIPVNSVSVTPHTPEGFIEVVYFSDKVPINACIEYVRPLGMYCFQHAGVRMDARTKIAIDSRLTNNPNNLGMSIGPTHVGHYSREDYARLQRVKDSEVEGEAQPEEYIEYDHYDDEVQHAPLLNDNRDTDLSKDKDGDDRIEKKKTKREIYQEIVLEKRRKTKYRETDPEYYEYYSDNKLEHDRQPVYYRNSDFEKYPTENDEFDYINPGYRALYSLQIANNEHIVKSLIPVNPDQDPDDPNREYRDPDKIYGLGYHPTDVSEFNPEYHDYPLPDEAGIDGKEIVFRKNEDGNFYLSSGVVKGVYNLRYDRAVDDTTAAKEGQIDIGTYDDEVVKAGDTGRTTPGDYTRPRPAVNPIMTSVGDAISMNSRNTQYILRTDSDGTYPPTKEPFNPDLPESEENEPDTIAIYKIKPDGDLDGKVEKKEDVDTD